MEADWREVRADSYTGGGGGALRMKITVMEQGTWGK